MPLSAGIKLGAYEILDQLGVGGMGEVYRGRDGRLRREVAIKILPEAFARDPERLARFEREARMLALLNHPGIAAIYGFEQVEGVPFLVLEYVPGQILKVLWRSRRLWRSPTRLPRHSQRRTRKASFTAT